MANIIKIDNAILKRNKRVEKKRKEKTREIRVYFLIVCGLFLAIDSCAMLCLDFSSKSFIFSL